MYDAIRPYIIASRRALLIGHVSPDGDSIGSLLGLKWILEGLNKEVIVASQDGVPASLRWLPGWDTVVVEVAGKGVDLVITLDSSDMERLGTVYQPRRHGKLPLINIDHHVTNTSFGDLNVIVGTATSTAEIVYQMAQALDWPIGPEAAQCLLTGVVTDTRGFRTPNVTAKALGIAQTLMEAGGSLVAVNENVLNRRTAGSICLWGKALAALQLDHGIIWTAIPLSMRTACHGVEISDTGLVNFLLSAEEARIAVVFSEREGGKVDVGMRSSPGVDIAQVALSLGGGGHPQAAGCSLEEPLAKAQERVLMALRESLDAQRDHPAHHDSAQA